MDQELRDRYDAILAMFTDEEREHLKRCSEVADAMHDTDEQRDASDWFISFLCEEARA